MCTYVLYIHIRTCTAYVYCTYVLCILCVLYVLCVLCVGDLAGLKREKSSIATELGVLKTEKKKATTDIASLRSKLEETEYNFTKSKKESFSLQQEVRR